MSEQENKPEVAKVEKPTRLVQNGVTRPLDGTLCGKAWTIADNMSELKGSPVAVADLLVETDKVGLNPANVKAEYSRWRKFHGISGRIESEASLKKKAEAREEAKLAKAKEREEAKAKREAEKAAKAAEREAKKAEREEAKKQKAAERAAKAAEKEAEKKAKAEAAAQAKADEASTDEAGEE